MCLSSCGESPIPAQSPDPEITTVTPNTRPLRAVCSHTQTNTYYNNTCSTLDSRTWGFYSGSV